MEEIKPIRVSALAVYGDHELLELMALKEDQETAHQALNEFHARFKQDLFDIVSCICRTYTNQAELAKIVFNNTIFKAYKSAHTFTVPDGTAAENIRGKILGWLSVIAKNDLKALFSLKNKIDRERETEAYGKMLSSGKVGSKKETVQEKIVQEAVQQIPKERDREIFFIYWLYYEEGEKGQAKKLPPEVYEELCRRYNTTEVNIRQIISRTNRIVKDYLKKHFKK